MHITYLGHAGFIAETDHIIVIMDPWLSPGGAFDASWFQLPRNHHLAPLVFEKLRDHQRSIFLYVSHEHQDHFDIEFLNSLPTRKFSLLIPGFSRSALASRLSNYECKEQITFRHQQEIPIPGGLLKFYLDDSKLNRDSGILVKANGESFFNLNDCKLFDMIPQIVREDGPIKAFACQFSGATWHPTCYDYPIEKYESLSKKKYMAKFESVAKAIELICPNVYIASAGPACFLDPMLFNLSCQQVNIFPRAATFIEFLNRRLIKSRPRIPNVMPGDVIDSTCGELISVGNERINEQNIETYLAEYATTYSEYFETRRLVNEAVNVEQTMQDLRAELERKLQSLPLADRIRVPLYFRLFESSKRILRVDFGKRVVEVVAGLSDAAYYEIAAPAWQISKVLSRELSWEEFSLTFRVRLKREPDVYDPVLHAYLLMDDVDLANYCELLLRIEANEDRIIVEADGTNYSVQRYCPHQGGDLAHGWIECGRYLTCPRHRWQFDLLEDGRCTTNGTSVQAVNVGPAMPAAQTQSSLRSSPRPVSVAD